MSRWWIVDFRSAAVDGLFSECLGALDDRRPELRPDHILLVGCSAGTAVNARKRIAAAASATRVHVLPKHGAEVLAGISDALLDMSLCRLLQKHNARAVESWPEAAVKADCPAAANLRFPERPPIEPAESGKPPMAYVSPLPPSQTGIASYSVELLQSLKDYYDLSLVVEAMPPRLPESLAHLPWMTAETFRGCAGGFNRIVYQVGNSPHHIWQFELLKHFPGVVVLHDYFLYDAVWWQQTAGSAPGVLRKALCEYHGFTAVAEFDCSDRERGAENYPVNTMVINEAAGLVVHSQHALQLHRQWQPDFPAADIRVIPHLRKLPDTNDRRAARKALGIDDDTLVIASFGGMNPKKGAERIIRAFLEGVGSGVFKQSRNPILVFAGALHAGRYATRIRRLLHAYPEAKRVKMTGYLSAGEYRLWLQAADIAVQLRFNSRGETSGAVLDAMSHGLPLIANTHGSNEELPESAVLLLPEDPSPAMLQEAMAALAESREKRSKFGQNARSWIRRRHDPDAVAALYRQAVEENTDHPLIRQRRWFDALPAAMGEGPFSSGQLRQISQSMQQLDLLHQSRRPRMLLDVTTLAWYDRKTGIERVTRELAVELLKSPPPGYCCELIRWRGDDGFRLARDYAAKLLGLAGPPAPNRPVEAGDGDIYLSLEWAPPLLRQAHDAFWEMKALGVRFCFTVHDLLPLFLPECFPEGTNEKMRDWFDRIARLADGLVCVSERVAADVAGRLGAVAPHAGPGVSYFHPGADFSRKPGDRIGFRQRRLLKRIEQSPGPRLLMVGTLEPRKGHAQVLDAVECLWRRGHILSLVIAGREGWGMGALVRRLNKHPEAGRRLFWCNRAGDAFLHRVYRCSDSLVAASLGEGFGLPLIEAAHFGLPVLARDIPVFREVAGDYARYFSAHDGAGLADEIEYWIVHHKEDLRSPLPLRCNSWTESAEQLKAAVWDALSPNSKFDKPVKSLFYRQC